MLVQITEKHIADGLGTNCIRCPLALALKDATGSDYSVNGYQYTKINKHYNERNYSLDYSTRKNLPQDIRNWIADFDAGRPVVPIEFEMEI
jgi:hypothetical protein